MNATHTGLNLTIFYSQIVQHGWMDEYEYTHYKTHHKHTQIMCFLSTVCKSAIFSVIVWAVRLMHMIQSHRHQRTAFKADTDSYYLPTNTQVESDGRM